MACILFQTLYCRLRLKVQMLVYDVIDLTHQQKKLGTSSKETKRKASSIRSKMGKTREALDELARWEALGTDQSPQQLRMKQDQLDAMLRNEPAPWDAIGVASQGNKLHWGRKFQLVIADRDRCKEQLVILRVERARFQTWVARKMANCLQACGTASTAQELLKSQSKSAGAVGKATGALTQHRSFQLGALLC
jgi:hypothetical protein